MDKKEQRNLLLRKRGALNRPYLNSKSILISRRVHRFLKKRRVVASYSPYNNEINPNIFFEPAFLFFPKVLDFYNVTMNFYRGVLIRSFKGIMEPKFNKRKVKKSQIEAIIVPGLGFDQRGYRIGYGRGFYDRFLSKLRALKIGVVLECCLLDKVNSNSEDIPVDVVITERRTIFCKLRR